MKSIIRTLVIFSLVLSVYTQQNYKLAASVFGSGGIKVSNSSYELNGTVGQAVIGNSSGSSYKQLAGFWQAQQMLVTDVGDESENILPTEYKLEQNYPNPFNPSRIIKYQIPAASTVSLIVYDILGRKAAELINNEWKEAGYHQFNFSAVGYHLSSGIHFYRLQTDGYSNVKKFVVLK